MPSATDSAARSPWVRDRLASSAASDGFICLYHGRVVSGKLRHPVLNVFRTQQACVGAYSRVQ